MFVLCLELSCRSGKLKKVDLGLGAYNLLFIFLWLILVYLIRIREHVCTFFFFPTAGLDSSNPGEYYQYSEPVVQGLIFNLIIPNSPPPNYYKTPSTTSLSQQTQQAQQNVS